MAKYLFLFPFILVCAETIAYLSDDMYVPALPDIMHEFNVTVQQTQYTLASWFLGAASMQLFIGPISDRLGRRPVLIAGMLLFVSSTLVCALATNLYLFILARFFQGSALCFIIVAGYASIHEVYEQKTVIRLLATMNSVTVLAPAFGPFLGAFLLTIANWRWSFNILFILGILVLLGFFAWIDESLPPDKRVPFKMSILLRQYKTIITNGRFLLILIAFCFIFSGFIAWLVAGPFLVIEHAHRSPLIFGIFQIYIFGSYIIATRLVKYVLAWWSLDKIIKISLAVSLLGGIYAIFSALFFPSFLAGLIIGFMIYSFGSGFVFAPLQRLAIESCNEPMGSRMAIVSTFISFTGLFATIWASFLYNGKLGSLAHVIFIASLAASLLFYLADKFFPTRNQDVIK